MEGGEEGGKGLSKKREREESEKEEGQEGGVIIGNCSLHVFLQYNIYIITKKD